MEIPGLAESQAQEDTLMNNLAMSQVKGATTLKGLLSPFQKKSTKEIG